jgi:polyisoprenoid-binding protein YceI
MRARMNTRVSIGAAAIFATTLLMVESVCAAELHLQIDPQQSQISTSVADPLGRLREAGDIQATFRIKSGSIDGDPQHPHETGHVQLVIDATTFDSGNTHRDNVVLGTALNTAQYQTISFESTSIEDVQIDAPGKMGHAVVVGNLTLHGTTRILRVPADVALDSDGILRADGETSFDYRDFGIQVPRLLAFPAGHDVTIHFHVTALRPASAG